MATTTQRFGLRLLSHMLERFVRTGTLRLIDADGGEHEFAGSQGPVATIRIHDPDLPLKIFFNPELNVGEAYMDQRLTLVDCSLEDFLGLFSANRASMASYPMQSLLRRVSSLFRQFQQYNPIGRAQQNVSHHYDLSRELYELFLDDDLQYSCAYFLSPDDSLEQAQENKRRHLASFFCYSDSQRRQKARLEDVDFDLYVQDPTHRRTQQPLRAES